MMSKSAGAIGSGSKSGGAGGASGRPAVKNLPKMQTVDKRDSRNGPNKGGGGSSKLEKVPKSYKFKWPRLFSSIDSLDMSTGFGAEPGGQLGINPDDMPVSGRKGVKRIY